MDYDTLIDAETWAFIHKTRECYPDDAGELSIAEQRRIYDAMCEVFHADYPDGLEVEDRLLGAVPVRIYSAGEPTRTVMYFHGGGFVVGGLESHDDVCAEICAQTGYRVVSVDYRLSPEFKHPAAFDDCWAATEWALTEFGDPVVLVGDSAGGNLAAAVAHKSRGRLKHIIGQVLIYPGLGGDPDQGSYIDHAEAPLLNRAYILAYKGIRGDDPTNAKDPTLAPLHDTDFSGLPPTVIFSAECDPLCDDGRIYRDQLVKAGGRAKWFNEAGMVHGYLRARHCSSRASESFERIELAIEALGQGLWPYD